MPTFSVTFMPKIIKIDYVR